MAKEPFDQFQQRLAELARQQQQKLAREQFQQTQEEQANFRQKEQLRQLALVKLAEIEQIPAQVEARRREQVRQLGQEARGLGLYDRLTDIRDRLWQPTYGAQFSLNEISKPRVTIRAKFNSEDERNAVIDAFRKRWQEKRESIQQLRGPTTRPVYNFWGKHVRDENTPVPEAY